MFKVFFIVVWMFSLGCTSQTPLTRVNIAQPTIEQETSSIWRTINDIDFLEEQGYTISLPEDAVIDSLIVKSKRGNFSDKDFSVIYNLLETKIFNQNNYALAIEKTKKQIKLLNTLIAKIDATKSEWDWDFQMFDTYNVVFTLFGTGGSYDPDEGTITLLTNKAGEFVGYENPANTIIHEITHMGMEYSIVQKYNLPHGLKERVVDTFVFLMFKDQLPEYRIQNMGDKKIDEHLRTPENIQSLNAIISKFVDQ